MLPLVLFRVSVDFFRPATMLFSFLTYSVRICPPAGRGPASRRRGLSPAVCGFGQSPFELLPPTARKRKGPLSEAIHSPH
jgi:hypothetical protein